MGSGSPVTISASANPLTITKTSDQSTYLVNSTAVFTVMIANPGAYGITIDKISDQLPAGFSFSGFDLTSAVTEANSTSVPLNGATGNITFEGGVLSGNTSYYVPSNGSIILKYRAIAPPAQAYNLNTTVQDFVGITQVGSANNTVSVSTVLAVNSFQLTGKSRLNSSFLHWEINDESDIHSYVVERSNDNIHFDQLWEQPAMGQNANTAKYDWEDSQLGKQSIYRIKAIRNNGNIQYSNLLKLSNSPKGLSVNAVYPNPVKNSCTVALQLEKSQVLNFQISDMKGRTAVQFKRNGTAGSSLVQVDRLGELAPGVYRLDISGPSGDFQMQLLKVN